MTIIGVSVLYKRVSIHWNGLLEWTTGLDTGLTQTVIKGLFTVGQRLSMLIQPVPVMLVL